MLFHFLHHRRLENAKLPPATGFRRIKSDIGRLHEFGRGLAVGGRDRGADGQPHVDFLVAGRTRRPHGGLDRGDQVGDLLSPPDRPLDDRELVAADASDEVGLPEALPQAPCHGLDDVVSGPMPEAVVDVFEPAEIEQHDTTLGPVSPDRTTNGITAKISEIPVVPGSAPGSVPTGTRGTGARTPAKLRSGC